MNVNDKTSSVGNTFNLPIDNPPSEPYTATWWFNGQLIDLTAPGTKYSVDPTTFSLSIANIGFPEGGIYQVELTVSGANVSDFRNYIVIRKYKIGSLTIHVIISWLSYAARSFPSASFDWMAPQAQNILPLIPLGVVVNPMLSSKLNITAAGVLVSSGNLDSTDGGVFTVMMRDFTGTARLTIDVLSKCLLSI